MRRHAAAVPQETTVRLAHYLTRDGLGSTRELVNASETVMTRYDYDVWPKARGRRHQAAGG
ncbi:MAG: hypothetical protein DRH70_08630 [Candidatus Coatesbacteria bacterium]|nr:MAG: hypothetical protein DRH70_08630 [Candidatus Coatesbacteria bacterium]